MTFILRLTRDEAGRLSGVIERVRSGEKSRFSGVEEIGPLIVQMADDTHGCGPEHRELGDTRIFATVPSIEFGVTNLRSTGSHTQLVPREVRRVRAE